MISNVKIKKILRQEKEKDNDESTYLGPFFGEFGPELIYWQGFVRWYIRMHPRDYVIVGGRPGHSFLYELADEYHEFHFNGSIESNGVMPVHGLDRQSYYGLICSLYTNGDIGDFLLEPNEIISKGWVEFGRPHFNQDFIKFKSLLEIGVSDPYVIFYPRNRGLDVGKNQSETLISGIVDLLKQKGLQVIIGGSLDSPREIEGATSSWKLAEDLRLDPTKWTEFQIALVNKSRLLISGESGSGFLGGLCQKPTIVFGSHRERERYTKTENIFSAPIRYICSREPSMTELDLALGELNEYLQE